MGYEAFGVGHDSKDTYNRYALFHFAHILFKQLAIKKIVYTLNLFKKQFVAE